VWFDEQIKGSTRDIYVVLAGQEIVAFFSIDKIDDETFESSSSGVLTAYAGRGIGTKCVEWRETIIRERGGKHIFTYISEKNEQSWRRFVKLGYVRSEEYILKELPAFNRTDKFYKWIKDI
jgi:ribosomal protein S18 acetylase RimI-like enzyme